MQSLRDVNVAAEASAGSDPPQSLWQPRNDVVQVNARLCRETHSIQHEICDRHLFLITGEHPFLKSLDRQQQVQVST